MAFLKQLQAVLWKNALLKSRNIVGTSFEIALPLLVMCIMLIIRALITTTDEIQSDHLEDKIVWSAPCYATNRIQQLSQDTETLAFQLAPKYGIPFDNVTNLSCNPAAIANDTKLSAWFKEVFSTHKVALSPKNNQLAQDLKSTFYSLYPHLAYAELFWMFDSDDDVNSYVQSDDYGRNGDPYIVAAIDLANSNVPSTPGAPFNLDYHIRFNTSDDTTVDPYQVPYLHSDQWTYTSGYAQKYYGHGYFFLQDFVENFFLAQANSVNYATANSTAFFGRSLTLAPMPVVKFTSDDFAGLVAQLLGLLFNIAYMWPVTTLIKAILEEKELKIREGMKMMGLSELVLFLSWFITYAVLFAITAALITLITFPTIFVHSDKGYIFAFFWIFGLDCIAYCWMIACFFNRAQLGSMVGRVLFLGLFFIYYAISANADIGTRTLACLDVPICFAQTAQHIATLEGAQTGVTANSVNRVSSYNFSYNAGIGMMILDFFLYTAIGLYFSRVYRGEFGLSESWYFCVSPKFWCPTLFHKERSPDMLLAGKRSPQGNSRDDDSKNISKSENDMLIEPVSEEVKAKLAVRIEKLRMEFEVEGQTRVAVNDLSVDLYEGQIFALLGHNGAGKSTTINMLCGMYPPTSGDAIIYGKSVVEEMELIRQQLGVCPQHNTLFPELSVREHLALYAKIKNVPADKIDSAIKEIVDQVGLTEKMNFFARSLSGGQQRKLSLAIALIGDSKVVFLDEPTSGMDPFSRRFTWDLLKKKKEGRVIILTTHFMDEADQLGDRIAIMHGGEIKCCGSSLFLKSKYGVGYTLTLTKQDAGEGGFNEAETRDLILRSVPGSDLLTNVAGEISFRLPLGESAHFADLFDQLDSRKEELGLESYGISVTTLEEVFLRVGRDESIRPEARALNRAFSKRNQEEMSSNGATTAAATDISEEEPHVDMDEKKGVPEKPHAIGIERQNSDSALNKVHVVEFSGSAFLHHVDALVRKRMMAAYRDRRTWFCTCICPGIMMVVGLLALTFGEHFTFPTTLLNVSNQFNTPLPMPYAAVTNDAEGLFAQRFQPDYVNLFNQTSLVVDNATKTMYAMSTYLIDTWQDPVATENGQSRYFAYVSSLNKQSALLTDDAVLFYNTTATYGIQITANYYNNLYLKWITGNKDSSLLLSDNPLPIAKPLQQLQNTIVATFFGLAMAFVPLAFVAYVVKEDSSKVKHQQMISGVSNLAYWVSNYVWDFINFLLPAALMMILLAAFNVKDMIGSNSGATILGLLLYGASIIPFSYVLSFFFENNNVATIAIMMIYILLGGVLGTVSPVLDFLGGNTAQVNSHLKFLYRLTPIYCVTEVAMNEFVRNSQAQFAEVKPLWDIEVVGYPMIFMAWEAVFWSLVVLGVEYVRYTPDLLARFVPSADVPEEPFEEDEDVIKEKERLMAMPEPTKGRPGDIITMKGLRKVYPAANGQPPKVAVHSVYLGIPEGQCFGYLGINGAGKTTTMKMLTGDVLPSKGQAFLNGMDISKHQMDVRRLIGYCPQFDSLIETLTGREHLQLFARIKGVDSKEIPQYVERLIKRLGLQEGIADKPCAGYSGGNKRKLCVGISLIGNPPIVFLDEPSTGMDPGSRRFMWDLIASTMKGRSVILTTHSMDECEALCTRLGIMVGGRLRCLGTLQHLRSRYGNDYQVDLHVHSTKEQQVHLQEWLNITFPGMKLLEAHDDSMKVRVPKTLEDGTRVSIANMFRIFEKERKRFNITDYSVSETTLEQIFIHFAKQQEMMDEKVYEQVGFQAEADNKPVASAALTKATNGHSSAAGGGTVVDVQPMLAEPLMRTHVQVHEAVRARAESGSDVAVNFRGDDAVADEAEREALRPVRVSVPTSTASGEFARKLQGTP